jgi:hypothetical protein
MFLADEFRQRRRAHSFGERLSRVCRFSLDGSEKIHGRMLAQINGAVVARGFAFSSAGDDAIVNFKSRRVRDGK